MSIEFLPQKPTTTQKNDSRYRNEQLVGPMDLCHSLLAARLASCFPDGSQLSRIHHYKFGWGDIHSQVELDTLVKTRTSFSSSRPCVTAHVV
jgi:hypothetical protein